MRQEESSGPQMDTDETQTEALTEFTGQKFNPTIWFIRSKNRPVDGPEKHGNEQDTEAHGHSG